MIHRVVLALSMTTCVVACLGKTTSLGGPNGNQSSASSVEDAAAPVSDAADLDAADAPDALVPGVVCYWYAWLPAATADSCLYNLPSGAPTSHDSPHFDPRSPSWNPANVYVETWFTDPPHQQVRAGYVGGPESCPAETGGWYYDETSRDAQGVHTRYLLCPTSCARVNDGAYLRLAATYCEAER